MCFIQEGAWNVNLQEYIAEREARDPELRAAGQAMEPEYTLLRKTIEVRVARTAASEMHASGSADDSCDE
jgi:hypothetical protein